MLCWHLRGARRRIKQREGSERALTTAGGAGHGGGASIITDPPAASTGTGHAQASVQTQSVGGWSGLLGHISHRFPALQPSLRLLPPAPFPQGETPERLAQLSL